VTTQRRRRSAPLWLELAVGLVAGPLESVGHAGTVDQPDAVVWEQVERWPSRLCPDDTRTAAGSPMDNADRRTLRELLGVTPAGLTIQYRSPDWSDPEAVASRARELLEARPRHLSPFVNWSEGADLRRQGFVARVGSSVRLAVGGYQVCVRDPQGRYWYFRHVPGDLWPGAGGAR
jgi:hypothetical protein